MGFPLQPIIFSIPSLAYLIIQRRREKPWDEILPKLGWQIGKPIFCLWALGLTAVTGALGWWAFQSIPPEIMEHPNINISDYADATPTVSTLLLIWLQEAIYVALGEEIFFRGLLGGWLVRKLGFVAGNSLQAVIFLLPHLLLLAVSLRLWPILLVQLVVGWLLGWLRHRSGSILPGWLAHSLTNVLGALGAMR